MPWSTEDPRPAEPVLGDAASLAALGSALQRAADDLVELLEALPDTTRAGDTAARLHTSRIRALRSVGTTVTAAMGLAGRRVSEHASELADALALARRIGERAGSSGLHVDGGTVGRPSGVHGVADPAAERERAETAARLQRVLDAVLLDLDSARGALRRDLGTVRRDVEQARTRCTSR